MVHYGQRITQVCFVSICIDSDYHNAVFVYVSGQRITPLCCVFLLIFVAFHVTFYSVVKTSTLPQFVFNSLILYNNLSVFSVKILDLNFQVDHLRVQLKKKFTKMWTKDFVLLEVVFLMFIYIYYIYIFIYIYICIYKYIFIYIYIYIHKHHNTS